MFAGRYEIIGSLGSGRLGEVHRAYDHNQHQLVALKLFRSGIEPCLVFREASLLTALQSDHVLRVLNADVSQDVPFIATQIAALGSAFDHINGSRGLRPDIVVTWVRHLLKGLTSCHLAGILHRDIKPPNLFVAREDLALLGDFGLAERMSSEGLVPAQGTPVYVAPEGHVTRTLSIRSEIYSVGLTAWTLLTGREPFSWIDDEDDLVKLCVTGFRERVRTYAPHVPQVLALAVERAYKVNPAERFATANAMDETLGRLRLPSSLWVEIEPTNEAEREWVSLPRALKLQIFRSDDGKQYDMQITHTRSGRRRREYCLTTSKDNLLKALRKIFDKC